MTVETIYKKNKRKSLSYNSTFTPYGQTLNPSTLAARPHPNVQSQHRQQL